MKVGRIEVRTSNWKPLVFTSILLASKFWEDINFWNIDYVERLDLYPLKSINRMESEVLSLCNYNIYVSAELYVEYLARIKQSLNPIFINPRTSPSMGLPQTGKEIFNRFK